MRAAAPSRSAWPLWAAFVLDAFGLYLLLAGFDIIPGTWPATQIDAWGVWLGALAVCSLARVFLLMALRGRLMKQPRRSVA